MKRWLEILLWVVIGALVVAFYIAGYVSELIGGR